VAGRPIHRDQVPFGVGQGIAVLIERV